MRRFGFSALLVGVGLAALGALALVPVRAQQAATAQTGPNKRIDLIVYRGCEDACRGFQDFLASHKVPATVKIFDAQTTDAKIPGFIAQIKQDKPDLVVTWGSSTALIVFGAAGKIDPEKNITDIPGVFMIVSQPIEAGLVSDYASSKRNFTGTLYLVPVSVQLDAALSYYKFSKVGVIYTPTEQNSKINTDQLKAEAAKRNIQVVDMPIALGADGKPDATSIPGLVDKLADQHVDLIYEGADTFLNINRKAFTERAESHHIPVFAAGEDPVRTGKALMGVVNEYYMVGQLTALKAQQVLAGTKPATIPIEAPKRFSFLINIPVAKDLELYPPMKLVRFAEFLQ